MEVIDPGVSGVWESGGGGGGGGRSILSGVLLLVWEL